MLQPTMILRIKRVKDFSEAETHGVQYENVLQQLWIDPDDVGRWPDAQWRDVPVVEEQ